MANMVSPNNPTCRLTWISSLFSAALPGLGRWQEGRLARAALDPQRTQEQYPGGGGRCGQGVGPMEPWAREAIDESFIDDAVKVKLQK